MVGYLNDSSRILQEWYNLFKKKNCFFSEIVQRHWEYIKKIGFSHFQDDYKNFAVLKDFFKYQFIDNIYCKLDTHSYQNLIVSTNCHKLVFMNGQFLPEFSSMSIDPWVLKFDTKFNHYDILNPINPNIFLYLTECLSNCITTITLPEKSKTIKPLYLLYIHAGSDIPVKLVTSHYFHHFDIGKNNDSCIIEHFVNINENAHFTGTRTIISINGQSKLKYIKLICENQNSYHISNQDVNIKNFSEIDSNIFSINGPKFTRHQINSKINYEKSNLSINSLSFLSKKNIADIRTYLEHNNRNYSKSKQLHKIIATDHSTGIFTGLIKVNKKSINTDAKMINNNLLLDQFSSIYSTPKLEIYSDSVQCRHGSTVGKIDIKCIFYLNARGISTKDAIKMLIYAFTTEIIKKVKDPVFQEFIKNRINFALIRNEEYGKKLSYRKD